MGKLEHANITVPNPARTAAMLINLFDWHIRWEAGAMNDGLTIHVGQDDSYLALYTGADRGRDQIPPTFQLSSSIVGSDAVAPAKVLQI
jgi:hypothetical protein